MPRMPLVVAAVLCCVVIEAVWAQSGSAPRHVIVTEIDGIIQPITAEYFTDAIDTADTSGAELVVLVLRTPGGLLDSTRTMVSRMITSRAPVVVFVGPSGARAASAGFIRLMAADVAAMAPATHAGAAHPVSGSGEYEFCAMARSGTRRRTKRRPRKPHPTRRLTCERWLKRAVATFLSPLKPSCKAAPSPIEKPWMPSPRSSI